MSYIQSGRLKTEPKMLAYHHQPRCHNQPSLEDVNQKSLAGQHKHVITYPVSNNTSIADMPKVTELIEITFKKCVLSLDIII